MRSLHAILLLMLMSSSSYSFSAIQTDWSGGAGVTGPVTEFGTAFAICTDIHFPEGLLSLGSCILQFPVEHLVCDYSEPGFSIAADIDEDGDLDVLHSDKYYISWMENVDGSGNVWSEQPVDSILWHPCVTQYVDINDDGDADLFGTLNSGGIIAWWESGGASGTWIRHLVDTSYTNVTGACAADVDGDGNIDILGASNNQSNISWWENTDGSGLSMVQHTIDDNYIAWTVNSGDMDGDGDIDVVSASYFQNSICWWENSDTSPGLFITSHDVGFTDNNENSYCIDMDNDGDVDLVGGGYYEAYVSWWENTDGIGTSWTEHNVSDSFNPNSNSISASDIDGDGDIDILGSSDVHKKVTWWENLNTTGDLWSEHIIEGFINGPTRPCVADINGDELSDVLATAAWDEEILWWEIFDYAAEGFLESSIFDTGSLSAWEEFSSTGELPDETLIGFQFRSSQDCFNMGAWSDTVYSPDTSLAGILADSTRYLQYKAILRTSNSAISPELFDVAFSYSQVGIEESSSSEVTTWSLHATENPSYGFISVTISAPEAGFAELFLYDISGRLVTSTSQELPSGTHSVNYYGLAEGVYFCTVHAGDFSATERVVVLE